jgi:DNA polymerase-3 subunit delta'
MLFKQIIGQETIKKQLIQSVKSNRIPHAQLFIGPQGSGKLPLAIAYARYINCTNKQNGDACGECSSCKKISKLAHPDLHFVFPVKRASESKPETSDDYLESWREELLENPYISPRRWYQRLNLENKQGIIPAQESNSIIRKLNYKSYEAEYKIMILWLPERMHPTTSNKLLKMIEEPPPKTLFLMVSENSDMLLNTILSRTQKIRVPKIDDESMFASLSQQFGLDEQKAREITHLANGSYLNALHFIQTDEESKAHFERFVSLMRLAYQRKVVELLGWTDETAPIGRENLKSFLQYAARMIRENFMLNLKLNDITYLTREEKEFSTKFSRFIHSNNARRIYEEFNRAHRDIQMNAHAKTVLFDLSVQLIKLLRI